MESTAEAITEKVNSLRHRAGLSVNALAKAMDFANGSSVQRYTDPKLYKGGYLKRDLVASFERALVGKGVPPITREEVWELAGPEFAGAGAVMTRPPTFGTKNLPVYAAAMGGDGYVIVTFEPIEYVDRPSYLEYVDDAYGVYIVSDSMYPAYRPSDIAYVNPRLPLKRDSDVVLFHTPPIGNAECIIKQLNGWDDYTLHLEQFNPPLKFDASRQEWPVVHRVLGRHNRS